jgi:hypothetical protein
VGRAEPLGDPRLFSARPAIAPCLMNRTPDNDDPGVPGFRTWRGVYVFVFGFFVAVVIALTAFSHHFG